MDKIRVFIPSFLDDFGLDMPSFRLYCHIFRRADTSGQCWESIEKMAKICKMDRKTAFKAFAFLQEHKLVSAEKRKGQTSVIHLTDYSVWLPIPNQVQGYTESGITTHTKSGTTTRTRSGIGVVPNQVQPPVPDQVHKGNPLEGYPTEGNPKEGRKEIFSDFQDQEAMHQKSSDAIANQKDPAPLNPPAPSVKPVENYSQKMEDRFNGKSNRFEPKGLAKNDYGDWHLGEVKGGSKLDSYNNWKPSLIIAAQNRKRIWKQPETITAAAQYIRNAFERCRDKDDWADFESLIAEAIAYEQALALNPTQSQYTEPTEPIVYDHDCRWEHYYPMTVKVNPHNGDIAIVWGMINTHPPDPVDERCQKFLAKANGDTGKLAKLLTAKHLADSSFASYPIQAENFANAKDSLIAALNQEIQKSLLQAA